MSKKKPSFLFELGLIAGALGGLVLARRMAEPGRMPRAALWQRVLAAKHGEVEAAVLMARVRARYDELYAQRPRFAHRALRLHLERGILPGLAIYQVLRETTSDREAALAEVGTLLEASAMHSPQRRLISILSYLPNPFALFRQPARWSMRNYPAAGWETEWVEDNPQCLAFNIHHCFYLDVLAAYGAPELTSLFCKGDDVMFAALPPSIIWERRGTLGRGNALCDFRWRRAAPLPVEGGS